MASSLYLLKELIGRSMERNDLPKSNGIFHLGIKICFKSFKS